MATYLVKPGDTLSAIAVRFHTTTLTLARINRINNPDLIFAGQTLTIPNGDVPPPPPPGVLSVPQLFKLVQKHGAEPGLDKIMVAAALAESGGNTNAIGDNGHSAGLWQMHDRGLGFGMTVADRCNPDIACDRMLPEFQRAFGGGQAEGLDGDDLAVHTYMFTERPFGFPDPTSGAGQRFLARYQSI
jgi:LysM domain/Lysozyme like domain